MTKALDLLQLGITLPDKLAMSVVSVARAERWSYARLSTAIHAAAAGLRQIAPAGTTVRIDLPFAPALPIAWLAVTANGAIPILDASKKAVADLLILAEGTDAPQGMRVLTDRQILTMPTSDSAPVDPSPCIAMSSDWQVELLASDRIMLIGEIPPRLALDLGCLLPWSSGATTLMTSAQTTPGQIPLLAFRHGATILAGPQDAFRRLLLRDWPVIPSLRMAICTDADPAPGLAGQWLGRTGCTLEPLA